MSMNGIDISSWQSGIDLAKVPCDFVIIKATEGLTYVNPDCDRAYQQGLKLGKKLESIILPERMALRKKQNTLSTISKDISERRFSHWTGKEAACPEVRPGRKNGWTGCGS